jgi:radical SAM superfamily enzyme YgiQ (UPF0313 family)
MKILLINPRLNLKHQALRMYVPPGIAYIASVIRMAGHKVIIFDFNLRDEKMLREELNNNDFNLIGITVFTDSFYFTEQIVAFIKMIRPEIPIVLGGPLVTSSPEIVFKNTSADIAVLGEGEETIIDLIETISKKCTLDKVRGICYKNGEDIQFTQPRLQIKNLDSIPFPAYDLFDLAYYFQAKPRIPYLEAFYPYLTLITHRGCGHKCKFCQTPFLWPKISFRSIKNVISEIVWQKKEFGVKGVYFRDDNFGPTEKRIRMLCQNLVDLDLGMSFDCLMRATTVISLSKQTLCLMKKAGCRGIRIGIESGDEQILRNTTKGVILTNIEKAITIIKDLGISADGSFLMIGHPKETEKSLENTFAFVSKLGIKSLSVNFALPLPGTSWYTNAKSRGLIPDEAEFFRQLRDWQDKPVVNMSYVSTEKLIAAENALRNF